MLLMTDEAIERDTLGLVLRFPVHEVQLLQQGPVWESGIMCLVSMVMPDRQVMHVTLRLSHIWHSGPNHEAAIDRVCDLCDAAIIVLVFSRRYPAIIAVPEAHVACMRVWFDFLTTALTYRRVLNVQLNSWVIPWVMLIVSDGAIFTEVNLSISHFCLHIQTAVTDLPV